jgi:hypothetical protein
MSFQEVNHLYNLCHNPYIILHRVESPLIKRFDRCISSLLKQSNQNLENPVCEIISSHLKKIRWNLLSETRHPVEFLNEHDQEFNYILQFGGAVLADNRLMEFENLRIELRHLQYNPLTTALAETLYDAEETRTVLKQLMLIPYGITKRSSSRRKDYLSGVLNNLNIECDVLTYAEARKRGNLSKEEVIFLPTPLAFGQASVNCPLAACSHFFFYDFITFDMENTGWRNNFAAFSENIHEAHFANFQVFLHENQDAYIEDFNPNHLEYPPVDIDNFEVPLEDYLVKDSVLYQPTEWNTFQSDDSENTDQNTTKSCLIVRIQSEDNLKAFLPLNSEVTKLSKNRRNQWVVTVIDPEDLKEDDYILLLQQEPEDHADETLNRLDQPIIESLEHWFQVQSYYRKWIAESCWFDVEQILKNIGIPQPYEYWFEEGRLGPQSLNSFRILCENTELHLSQDEINNIRNALGAWHAARVKAGHETSPIFAQRAIVILNQLTQQDPDFEQSNDSTIKVTLGEISLGSYVIGMVDDITGPVEVPQHLCRRILNYRGKPWLQ